MMGTLKLWRLRLLLVLVTAALAGACANEPKVLDTPALAQAEHVEYRIGPGDTLQVFVWNHPELTVTVPVRPDGMISTPLIEGVPAEGKTATQLARDLETALSEYVRNPTVSVMVTGFVGAYADQVRVSSGRQRSRSRCRIAPT